MHDPSCVWHKELPLTWNFKAWLPDSIQTPSAFKPPAAAHISRAWLRLKHTCNSLPAAAVLQLFSVVWTTCVGPEEQLQPHRASCQGISALALCSESVLMASSVESCPKAIVHLLEARATLSHQGPRERHLPASRLPPPPSGTGSSLCQNFLYSHFSAT